MTPKTVFIAAPARKAGKTLLTEFLLRALPGAGAIKITCCRSGGSCPRSNPCGVCRALTQPYALIEDRETLALPGKDTARLLAAATGKVLWSQVRDFALQEGMAAALARFEQEPVVLVEGNAAFLSRPPDLGLLVIGNGPLKASVKPTLPFINGVVINLRPDHPRPELIEGLPADIPVFAFDAARPEGDPEAVKLLLWIKERLAWASTGEAIIPKSGNNTLPLL